MAANSRPTIARNVSRRASKTTPETTSQRRSRRSSSASCITLATKVRRKSSACQPATRIPLAQLLWLLCCLGVAHHHQHAMAECPSVCECKWKSGKESVLCLNANLTHIPAPLDAGTQVLDLTGNEIAHIPHDTFAAINLLNLQKVYLAKCRLRAIERFAFRELINLVELDLSHNQLTSIPSAAFESVPELREIKLNGNPIQRVADDAFAHVPQLVRLELSDCRLAAVEVRAFAGLESSLEWLKLDGNRLSEVRSGTITSLANLHGIELARNQWNCSCALRPLRVWMLHENIPYGVPPLCRAPARLAGRTWDKIDLDDFACVPQIIATDTTAHGVEGRNVTMSCFVEGVPEPSVRWMVKNRVIANLTAPGDTAAASAPRTAAATQGRKTYVVNMLRNAANLTILTADMQDAGIYTCAAENKAGKVEASVTLAVSRRPPEAPLGAKIVLLCVLIALVFVVASSFGAVCLCSLRRKRKMRLWNSVPPARTDSYEKIEMMARSGGGHDGSGGGGGGGGGKPDLGRGGGRGNGGLFHGEENGYLRTATTPLNCGSDDGGGGGGGDAGVAIVNPSGGGGGAGAKRNGDYRNVPTHCDDDGTGYEDNADNGGGGGIHSKPASLGHAAGATAAQSSSSSSSSVARWKGKGGAAMRASPQDVKRKASSAAAAAASAAAGGGAAAATASSAGATLGDSDLHIPRLIDIGSNPDSASSSISSQVDAAARLGGVSNNGGGGGYAAHLNNWSATRTTTPIETTKIHSPHSKRRGGGDYKSAAGGGGFYGSDEVSTSVFCGANSAEHDLFDGNYPDLLDIAKYAVAQATSGAQYPGAAAAAAASSSSNGALCTLPRKLKQTGKYFKHSSSDSQSPLLADNSSSSKYGSSTLSDVAFLNDLAAIGRRFSAESSYSNYASGGATYTSGQRSNSFLNLVHSASKSGGGGGGGGGGATGGSNATALALSKVAAAAAVAAGLRRNPPSLPSSPVRDLHQQLQLQLPPLPPTQQPHQHQRSFSSAATPLLDFSSLTTRTGVSSGAGTSGGAGGGTSGLTPTPHTPTTTQPSTATAYDYHAAQLERFLEEYRNLQDQLCKMKETCETIRKKETPLRGAIGHAADPMMFNAALAASSGAPLPHPTPTMLKNKAILPGQPPDPPPYWLHRNAMLKRLNESQSHDIFKS